MYEVKYLYFLQYILIALLAILPREFAPAYQAGCGPDDASYTDVNDIIGCYNYLNNFGTIQCPVAAGEVVKLFCKIGQGQVSGIGSTAASASSLW